MSEKDMGLLPIMSPLFNLREICKQMSLLEDHLNNVRKRCPDCIRKHFLTIEALFEEAVSLDKDQEYAEVLDGKAQDIRDLQGSWLDDDSDENYLLLAQALRAIRKEFAPLCFDVRKLARVERLSSRRHVCDRYKGVSFSNIRELVKRATKSEVEKEDEAIASLVRRNPDKKPPRKDLRENVYNTGDPDLQGLGRGDGGDPHLSRRDRKMGSRRYL